MEPQARTGLQTQVPEVEPPRFAQIFLLDDAGRFLCAFDRRFSPLGASALEPSVAAEALRVEAEGLLSLRSAITRPAAGGRLLSISGDSCFLHALLDDGFEEEESRRLLAALLAFESAQGPSGLAAPGDRAWLHATRATLRRAFASPPATLAPPRAPEVFLHSALGIRGARFTLELLLRNETSASAFDAKVTFASPASFLEPVALFGEGAEVFGSEIRFEGPLEPGLRRLMLHFEPVEPRTGPLSLRLTYRDLGGTARTVPARPRLATASFPRMAVALPRDAGDLLACFARADRVRDAWRFRAPQVVGPAFAFARAKEAVERERPLRVFEFSSGKPHYYEAWYLAQLGKDGPPVIVEAALWGDFGHLDLRVATERQEDLVGILAEYRRRVRELLSERFMGTRAPLAARAPSSGRGGPAPPGLHGPLLMSHLQGRIGASALLRALGHAKEWDAGNDADLVAEFESVMSNRETAGGARRQTPPSARLPEGRLPDEDFELVPGLLAAFRRLVLPEVQARIDAMQARRGRPAGAGRLAAQAGPDLA